MLQVIIIIALLTALFALSSIGLGIIRVLLGKGIDLFFFIIKGLAWLVCILITIPIVLALL